MGMLFFLVSPTVQLIAVHLSWVKYFDKAQNTSGEYGISAELELFCPKTVWAWKAN